MTEQTCVWAEDEGGWWETGCGNEYEFIDGGPTENRQKYCGYCGKPLVERPYEPEAA